MYRNLGLFVILAILWGATFMVIKAGLAYIPPVLFAAVRYDIAGAIMLGYAAYQTTHWRPRTRNEWVTVTIGATLVIAAYNAFLFIGEQGVTSAVAAILVGMNPVLAAVFSRGILSTDRLTPLGVAGLLLGLIGVGFVANVDPTNLLASGFIASGFVLLAAVSVALGSVLIQRVGSSLSTEGFVAWSCAIGAVQLHLLALGLPGQSLAQAEWTTGAIVAVVFLAVFASAIGYFIYFDLLDKLGAIEINLISYATPVPAAISGWLVLGEIIDVTTVIGFVMVFAGFALLKREALREALPRLRAVVPR
jgi:drug/metabolite transporter (DMT)-like permease